MDYAKGSALIQKIYEEAEQPQALASSSLSKSIGTALDVVFASNTQSFREVALGCALVKMLDPSRDIRKPYANQGAKAYNGRTFDERVVNPFLQDGQFPCSKGPYLATFRRSVEFTEATRDGIRDKNAFDAFLKVIADIEAADTSHARDLSLAIMQRFILLRSQSVVPVFKIAKLSLAQIGLVTISMLRAKSGGLLPVVFSVAMLHAVNRHFSLGWKVEWQGINVSDKSSGSGGDITVSKAGKTLLSIEVTERPIERTRVVSTFNTKIVKSGVKDYLFLHTDADPKEDAVAAASNYFAQGHEIVFFRVDDWISANLVTLGSAGRATFVEALIELLEGEEVPAKLRVIWNEKVKSVAGA